MQALQSASVGDDRPAASDIGPVDFPYPASRGRSAIASLRCVPSLCFDTCARAPVTRPLPAVLRAHLPALLTDCPAATEGGGRWFPGLLSGGRSAIALPRSHSPCSPLPWPFCDISGIPPPAMSIDLLRARIGREQFRGLHGYRPPSFAPLPLVKGTYSGEIKSRSRPRNWDFRPGNAIFREWTSVVVSVCVYGLHAASLA